MAPIDWGNIEAPVMEGPLTEGVGDEDAPNCSDLVRLPPQDAIRGLQDDGTGGSSESRDFEVAPHFLEEDYWDEMNYEGMEGGSRPARVRCSRATVPAADADVVRRAIQLKKGAGAIFAPETGLGDAWAAIVCLGGQEEAGNFWRPPNAGCRLVCT